MAGCYILFMEAVMKHTRINIWNKGEYSYEAAYGFEPNIRTYIHDDDEVRDCMLVVPGGGYCMVVPSEAEVVAKTFYEKGMNAFVLSYTTDITFSIPLLNQPLKDISRAVRLIRSKSTEFNIDPDRLVICGFSAGGHLCGSLCVHYDDVTEEDVALSKFSNRPDAAILSYPVITSGDKTHPSSIEALVGADASKEKRDYYSIEKNVSPDTPPCFIWQTVTDDLVPIENSYLMAAALAAKNIPHTLHAFPYGPHGLSVSNKDFYLGRHGEDYTFEQLKLATNAVRDGRGIKVSEKRTNEIIEQFFSEESPWFKEADKIDEKTMEESFENPYEDVSKWPDMAYEWLIKVI